MSYKQSIEVVINDKPYSAVVERCIETNLYVGFVPRIPGAHTQASTLAELKEKLGEVVEMLLEDYDEFGTRTKPSC